MRVFIFLVFIADLGITNIFGESESSEKVHVYKSSFLLEFEDEPGLQFAILEYSVDGSYEETQIVGTGEKAENGNWRLGDSNKRIKPGVDIDYEIRVRQNNIWRVKTRKCYQVPMWGNLNFKS